MAAMPLVIAADRAASFSRDARQLLPRREMVAWFWLMPIASFRSISSVSTTITAL